MHHLHRPAWTVVTTLVLALLLPLVAQARSTERIYPAQDAVDGPYGQDYLLDVPFALKGAPGAPSGKKLSTVRTDQTSSGALRSDEKACHIAFLTALKRLQQRTRESGGDAIVDIVSVTRGERTESPTDFRCVAGAVVVHVGLEGTVIETD
ncbi:MAG: hypothetical protein ACQGVC_24075 [Myxococcota bacterium]